MSDHFMPSRRTLLKIGAAAALSSGLHSRVLAQTQLRTTFVDEGGIWRWADGQEVSLFGVNYNLGSASAFRFAKQSGQSFEKIIEADFAHFRRLGFDGIRLCFWGDWEATKPNGDLLENEHLHVLDMLVQQAALQDFSCLLSPIVTYSSFWPDAQQKPATGIASAFEKSELGTNPAAISAQCRYIEQLLARTNPLTGRRYSADPAIVAVEPINEPWHHSSDQIGSIRYINALSDSIRKSGFQGPVFYNVTQDMGIAPAIQRSKVQGATFAWYPTGLQNGHPVEGNGLLLVDDYPQFDDPALGDKTKLVYEFDAADTMDSYYYPAMVREFRRGGAQFAAMFAYDPLTSAASNSEFNDHFLNLVYTPAKAISALIAGIAMHELPRGRDYGSYPENRKFSGFRVDDRENLSEYVGERAFFHSNDTATRPERLQHLERIGGCGSSPIVDYDGTGAWFLDKVEQGVWRLEVYPDTALVENPFQFRRPSREAVRVVFRERKMVLELPDLGQNFIVSTPDGRALDKASSGRFGVMPGVYRLSREPTTVEVDNRYFVVAPQKFEPVLQHAAPTTLTDGKAWRVSVALISPEPPKDVQIHVRTEKGFEAVELEAGRGFQFNGVIPGSKISRGFLEYYVSYRIGDSKRQLVPNEGGTLPGEWDFPRKGGFRVPVLSADDPLLLFDAQRDGSEIIVPYSNYVSEPPVVVMGENGRAALELDGKALDSALHSDVPAQFSWNSPIENQGRDLAAFKSVVVEGRSVLEGPGRATVILIERSGSAWGANFELSPSHSQSRIALSEFKRVDAAMLPRDYPMSINPYFHRSPSPQLDKASQPVLEELQAVQITLGKRFLGEEKPSVQIENISLAP